MAASGGYKHEEQKSSSSGEFRNRKEYIATYSFPRARVFLDEYNLQVTPRCATLLAELRTAVAKVNENLRQKSHVDKDGALKSALAVRDRFYAEFGHIFATSFQLGGQLTGSKTSDSFAITNENAMRDAMKVSAAVSFSRLGVSGSVSASHEANDSIKNQSSAVGTASALAWSARGGNTLLASK